jgi:hypothetical protein
MRGLKANRVNDIFYSRFRTKIVQIRSSTTDRTTHEILGWIERMTELTSEKRLSAAQLLQIVSLAKQKGGPGAITLKSGQKRAREE